MDETGMRVNRENNWLWVGVIKDPDTMVFRNDEHRSSTIVDEFLGDDFSGALGSDFYRMFPCFEIRSHSRKPLSIPGFALR